MNWRLALRQEGDMETGIGERLVRVKSAIANFASTVPSNPVNSNPSYPNHGALL